MKSMIVFICLFLVSCSSGRRSDNSKFNSQNKFVLSDASGNFLVTREIKTKGNKLISRIKVFDSNMDQELESTVAVSKVGYLKNTENKDIAVIPDASQFKIWFNKIEYTSRGKFNRRTKELNIQVTGDEKGKQNLRNSIPAGSRYCYFSQLPECVKLQRLLFKAQKEKVSLYLIWDNYPYHTELYNGLSNQPFVLAEFQLSDVNKTELKYSLDLGNQIIFYHFDRKLNFEKMFWVSQGMSLTRK